VTLCARIRKALIQAPSTSAEISAVLRIPRRRAQIGIWMVCHIGHAFAMTPTVPQEGTRALKLYAISQRGRWYHGGFKSC